MQLDKAIKERHSVRRFLSKKPDWRDIIECIDSARYAPMAGNNYTLKFIMVSDKEKIQKIADAAQQNFINQAHYIIVVCTDSGKTTTLYEGRAERYCQQQAGAAIQNFLLAIEQKKLATCWVGHFVDHLVKETLRIPEKINVEAIFPIGYEFGKTKKSTKINMDRILYFEKYGNKQMRKIKMIEV